MQINNRLQYLDHCVAGDITSFNELLSKNVFNTFDRSYEIYRDYIKQKQSIEKIHCHIDATDLVVKLTSNKSLEEIVSNNIPKKVRPLKSADGIELHMKLMDIPNIDYKGVDSA